MLNNYLITDPCYILPPEVWDECKGDIEATEAALKSYTKDDTAFVVNTGYGDWVNSIEAKKDLAVNKGKFAADSGLVCWCRVDDDVLVEIKDKLGMSFDNLVACIRTGRLLYALADMSLPNWTVIKVYDMLNDELVAFSEEA